MFVLFEPGSLLSLGLVLLLGRLVALVLRRRWGLAEARREEVARLIRLAAEEAAAAEVESSVAAGGTGRSGLSDGTFEPGSRGAAGGGGGGGRRCVVCCSPTTARCAQCKSVRYCSRKCQIVHWRQGHKEECCPARVDHGNGRLRVFGLNEQAERSELIGNSLEIEGTPFSRMVEVILKRSTSSESNYSSEVFSEEDNFQDKPFENSSGTESSSDSSTSSVFSGPIETSEDALTSDFTTRTSPEQSASACLSDTSPVRSGESLSSFSSTFPRTVGEASSCKIEEVEGPSGVGPSGSENFTISSLSTECHDEIVGIRASHNTKVDKVTDKTFQDGENSGVCVRPPFQMTSKLSGQVKPSLSISRNEGSSCKLAPLKAAVMLDSTVTTVPGLYKSDHVSSGRDNHACILKSKESTCQSSTYVDHRPLSGGGHSVLSGISSKVDNSLNMPTRPSQSSLYVLNGTRDLKMSRKVIGQIKASKVSRQYPSGTSSLIPEKHNYKMLFSYDTFVKLYNLDVNLRPFGLTNCGNSCYANAVLQCLAFTRPVTAYLLEGFHMKTCPKKDWCFTCELESLLVKAKQGTSPLSPIRIISHIKKIGRNLDRGREEDAHEFLRYAIDAMHSACLKEAGASEEGRMSEDLTLIEFIFGGYLQSKIRCMRCNGKSEQHERMMDLNVEIHGDVRTLGEALTHFTTTEILDGGNKYYCNRCKSYERAKKKLRILEAPNVLTITLKRYQSGKFGKLNKAIQFPDCINLAPYMSGKEDKSPVYRLYAVVVHLDIMNSAFSGHYVCYVKNSQGKWYEIDDSVVKPVDLDTVLTKGAYMLLYTRSSPRAPNMYGKVLSRDYINTKKSKCAGDVSSHHEENHNARISSTTKPCSSEDRSSRAYHSATNGHVNSGSHGMFDERFRNPSVNSSSDNSSLLSCSDEGSWSTESTRNSFSTDDYSEYLFGEPFDIT
ncbi:ubiquitin carboxyl-terminal hydrolase 17-like [Iris pallida]|uniref:ubiquitinyl hydrolase 1 n=1 Tax=Iris pallida TaxID=29817 RepID=A0AAX6FIW7_IRIPA|nr:ubiquitin carboxyl-terminal hydrolase 17-like [Iris pallida]